MYRPISEVDSLKDCRAYLQSLPEVDSPELFGMHHCAERQYLKVQAELFINSIVSTQPTYSTDIIRLLFEAFSSSSSFPSCSSSSNIAEAETINSCLKY